MGLYKLYSCNVEIQYKSWFLSKAMLFTVITTVLNIILPFFVAYRSRGFWLKSQTYYEQPTIQFTYDYLLLAETVDPSQPIICAETSILNEEISNEENCAGMQVQEYDYNGDGKNDMLNFIFNLNVPTDRTIASITVILALDFQLKATCPLHMQSLAVIHENFIVPPSGLKYYGDIELYQVSHLPCMRNMVDTKYNTSLLNHFLDTNENIVDFILEQYINREVITQTKKLHSRSQNGHTGNMDVNMHIRIPETKIRYIPSLLQELRWAWPQYLSLVFIFYWIFNKIKRFVFNNRLLMAWEIIPWKRG
ncbi:transmembrane protein 231-like [Achroia grisella]|uniref:transmembrane protein 231-like n=1 Tax=Achroia grisella TaxID=688607 RepID=UPI0027D2B0E0|nr:transmembrane protein 231-like [Achroia grisella]